MLDTLKHRARKMLVKFFQEAELYLATLCCFVLDIIIEGRVSKTLTRFFQEAGLVLITLLCLIVSKGILAYEHFFPGYYAQREDSEIKNTWIEEEDP